MREASINITVAEYIPLKDASFKLSCQEAGKVFEDSWDAQYAYCLEVK